MQRVTHNRRAPMRLVPLLLSLAAVMLFACQASPQSFPSSQPSSGAHGAATVQAAYPPTGAVAIFAGGCFWCMESSFQPIEGVTRVLSGYTHGSEVAPSYGEVSSGRTGHVEAVWVEYDPAVVSYEALLDVYWRSMDPTDDGGQFADRGAQYHPAIFVQSAEERAAAEASRDALAASGVFNAPIVVPIWDASAFWIAEDYHQDYYLTHPRRYEQYRRGSGRSGFLERTWGEDAH